MRKYYSLITMLAGIASLSFAETNALIEVQFFKNWVIEREPNFGHFNLAIKNTGTVSILLANDPGYFQIGQLATRLLPLDSSRDSRQEEEYKIMGGAGECFSLPPGETHVYEGRKFFLPKSQIPFSEEMRFTVSVYLGKGFWLDSEPMTLKGVAPDSEEHIATVTDGGNPHQYELTAVTYKNERWLYSSLQGSSSYFSVCPLSLTNKIRVEPHDAKGLFKIWDGNKPMIFHMTQVMLTEGSDENNVYGKWTRERKQKAEADNAEVRRKKAEAQTP